MGQGCCSCCKETGQGKETEGEEEEEVSLEQEGWRGCVRSWFSRQSSLRYSCIILQGRSHRFDVGLWEFSCSAIYLDTKSIQKLFRILMMSSEDVERNEMQSIVIE
jgi:hypothetical protein